MVLNWIKYILITLALLVVVGIGASVLLYFIFGIDIRDLLTDSPQTPQTVVTNTQSLSPEMEETVAAYRDSFWVLDDDLKTYQITKSKAEEIIERHATKDTLSKIELNDEMLILTNYAAAARNVYPEEGLRVFAQIYNDDRYSGKVRANAIMHAMFFAVEKLGTEELSIQNANDWIFADTLFASVLQNTEYEGMYLESQTDVFSAASAGLAHAVAISDSDSLSAKVESLHLDVKLDLIVDELISSRDEQVWTKLGEMNWSEEELNPIVDLLVEYSPLHSRVISVMSNSFDYDDKYAHAAQNMIRSYTTMRALGIDTEAQISDMHEAVVRYSHKYLSTASPARAENIKVYLGVYAWYETCNYIIRTGYDLSEPTNLSRALELAEPFFQLSFADMRLLLVGAAMGERESGACYYPFILLGQQSSEFKEALVSGIGGWSESQFE